MSNGESVENEQTNDQPKLIIEPETKPINPGKGILVPHDRSLKQPVIAFCSNPECAENGKEFNFITEHDRFCCPKCKNDQPPGVGLLVLIHVLMRDNQGPVTGAKGLKYKIACDSKRAYLATATNLEGATGDPTCANCPDCLKKVTEMQGFRLFAKAPT